VDLDRGVQKELKKLPAHIVTKLQSWIDALERFGLREVRKQPGYHDEPLAGDRKGQRSVRLSKAYRAFYVERNDGEIEVVLVIEVNKHEY
jgi:proteic killer suppression protein